MAGDLGKADDGLGRPERRGFFECRLCRHVGITVFISILLLEGAILFYFSRDFERERLLELERVNFAAIQSLFVGTSQATGDGGLLADATMLARATDIRGGALYRVDGGFIGVFGEAPETRIYDTMATAGDGRLLADKTRYEVKWRFSVAQPSLMMIARLDASQVKTAVAKFFWRILALVGAISVIVTAVTMAILSHLTLAPVLALRQSLLAAGDDPASPERHKITPERADELGEAFEAFNRMLDRLAESNREIKQRQIELRASEERFKDVAEATSDWVWETGPDLQYTYISDRFFKETGHRPEDIIGKTLREFAGDEVSDENLRPCLAQEQIMRNRIPIRNYLHSQKDSNGRVRYVSLSANPYFDQDGVFLGYRGATTDITERRRTERELMQHKKVESLGRLASGIAHNLNNMLQPILILSQALIEDTPAGSKKRETLDIICQASLNAKGLVDKITEFGHEKTLSLTSVDSYQVVRKGLDLIYSIVPHGITITEFLDKSTGFVFVDASQTQTVLMNLIANAIDAMEGKPGEITVSLGPAQIEEISAISDQINGAARYAKLSVTDSGAGMDEETLSRIFDPFFTTKEVGKGTGLGLSTAFTIITKQGGTIQASSTPGSGAVVDVFLPLDIRDIEREIE